VTAIPGMDKMLGSRGLDCYEPARYEIDGMEKNLKTSRWTWSMVEGHLEPVMETKPSEGPSMYPSHQCTQLIKAGQEHKSIN
jgi:hypothetical protein